jgi:hypothetical protein
MAHLRSTDGRAVAVGDGLGWLVEQWQRGDIFAQRSVFILPEDTASGILDVYTGLYTSADVRRLPIMQNGKASGDSIYLTAIDIQ